MAARGLRVPFRLRPFSRISRVRKLLKPTTGALIQQFLKQRVLPRVTPQLRPARLSARIVDGRIEGQLQLTTKGDGTEQAVQERTNIGSTAILGNGSANTLSSELDKYLIFKISEYTPRRGRKFAQKNHKKRPPGDTIWESSFDAKRNPVLDAKQYLILRKLTTTILCSTKQPGFFNKILFRWLKQAQTCPSIIPYLSSQAWEALFANERGGLPTNLTILVAEIMDAHRIRRTERQENDYIGAIFWNRDRADAVHRWIRLMRSKKRPSEETWNMGIKLFSLRQEPARAMILYRQMEEINGHGDPKLLVPIILACNHTFRRKNAWSTFLEFRKMVNKDPKSIKSNHLEDIALSFMDSMAPSGAFAVLRYMWKKGFAVPEYTKEAAMFYQSIVKNPRVLHQFSHSLLDTLKERVSDKYFYASWMKNLVRLGRADLTLQVKQVMEDNGLRPDSQHINGIIRGFLNQGYVEQAEEQAAELIQQRLRNLESQTKAMERKAARKSKQPLSITDESLPEEIRGQVTLGPLYSIEAELNKPPEATAQTFSILLLHFARRRNFDKVHQYTQLMFQCQIRLTAYAFNHLLSMFLKQNDVMRLESTFRLMIDDLGVKPDQVTWTIMWHALSKRYTQRRKRNPTFITPRALFAQMTKCIPPFKIADPSSEWGRQPKSQDIWLLLIRSFILVRDWHGLIVALNAGDMLWRMRVNGKVYEAVVMGLLRKGILGLNLMAAHGNNGRVKLTGGMLTKGISEFKEMQSQLSTKAKLAKIHLKDREAAIKQWDKLQEKWRKIPAEESAAALEAVTIVLRKQAGDVHSLASIEKLKEARAEMAVPQVGIKGVMVGEVPYHRQQPQSSWIAGLY
ncbi:hypothetical protein BDZ91DRAFT_708472 [Kalaharituber pfeilii]|nr:hypothetical protein BDZ91DRAFT_708472 [Kalaharituber pfeilii]